MRVVIVTGTQPHHQNLCAKITAGYNVVGIIHPAAESSRPSFLIRRLVRQAKAHGGPMVIMHMLGKSAVREKRGRRPEAGPPEPQVDFSGGVAAYDRIPRSMIHSGCDVRQPSSHDLLRALRPDVTLCLGGPIYPEPFIEASPLMLNFHSGISPIYNGAASIPFAFANSHPHLCGGTLMLMNAQVDGGRILGHFLPGIEPGDSPDSLFAKTARGAALMFARLLNHLQTWGSDLLSVPQPAPLFYTRGFQFGWYHKEMIARNLREDIAARFERAETQVEYWREPTEMAARDTYRATMESLLWRAAKAN